MHKESPKRSELRRVLEVMLSNNDSERTLRSCLKKIVSLTVIENGALKVND